MLNRSVRVYDLPISTGAINALRSEGMETVGDILARREELGPYDWERRLVRIPNFAAGRLRELKEVLAPLLADDSAQNASKVVSNSAKKPPRAGMGRPKGSPNKTTALLKDAILQAATDAGNGDMVEYLKAQAIANPGPFLSLLGKVLPMQVTGEDGGALEINVTIGGK